MFEILFFGSAHVSDEVEYTWYWSNNENCMQAAVIVNGRWVRIDC